MPSSLGRAWPRGFSCQGTVDGWNCSFPHEPLSNGFSPMCPLTSHVTLSQKPGKYTPLTFSALSAHKLGIFMPPSRHPMKKHICSCCTIELVNTGTWNIRNPRKSSFAKMFRKRAGGKRFLFPLLSSTSLLRPPRESLCRLRTLNAIKKKKKRRNVVRETLYARLSRPATKLGREERRERVSSTAFPRLVRSL